ncbi:MAG: cation diffusion facilitator family transporter [Acidobacteriota bacterium]
MLTERLVRAFVRTPEKSDDPQVRKAFGVLEGWTSVAVNLVLFAVKVVPGVAIGSVALIADAFHSLGDVLSSAVVIWGFRAAARPSDPEHPFGHGRLESVTSLVVSLMLFLTAWEFGRASIGRLREPREVEASTLLIVVLVATMAVKEWLSRFSLTLGKRIGSAALIGDFWHHRSDVLATGVVVAALLGARFGWWWVDGVGGLIVSAIIAWAGYQLWRDSVDPLIGEAPSPGVLQEMREIAQSIPGVDDVHDLIVHRYGSLVVTSVHVEVSSSLDIEAGHEVAEAVEQRLNERFAGWAVVHVDPVNRSHPMYAEVQAFLAEALPKIPGVAGFHDLRIVGSEARPFAVFDLQTEGGDPEAVAAAVREAVSERFPSLLKVGINLEPRYVY